MHSAHHIRYLRRQDIDDAKWDACIHLIYGKSYYLDHMTDGQWDALIMGDYEIIMPLTWRRKMGCSLSLPASLYPTAGAFCRVSYPVEQDPCISERV